MVVLALLLTLSSVAQAELYLEGFLGGTAGTNMGLQLPPVRSAAAGGSGTTTERGTAATTTQQSDSRLVSQYEQQRRGDARLYYRRQGGVLVCTHRGFKAAIPGLDEILRGLHDISFQQLRVSPQSVTVSDRDDQRVFQGTFPGEFYSNGYVVTWAFMLAARYCFLPNDKVPFGRLQPWVGVGPAVMRTGMRPKATVFNPDGTLGALASPGWHCTVAPALVVDAGLRCMLLSKISLISASGTGMPSPTTILASPISMAASRGSIFRQPLTSSMACWGSLPLLN